MLFLATQGSKMNLSEIGLRQLLLHRARCLDQSREIQADAVGDWRLLKADEQSRVDALLDEAHRCTVEFDRRRREWAEGATDAAALAEATQRQSEGLYSRSSF